METIKIDGREFHGITEALSGSQDDFILLQLRRSGAMEVLADRPPNLSTEEKNKISDEMFNRVIESGRKYKLLAGLLTEEGKKWTLADAQHNAERFAALTDSQDKLTMNRELMRHVALFSRFGEASSQTSPNSSSQSEEVPATANAEPATSAISTK